MYLKAYKYVSDLFRSYMGLGDAILNPKNRSLRTREIIVLAVVAVYKTPSMLYAHTRIAMKLGLSKAQCALASKRDKTF